MKNTILIASGNPGKIKEIEEILAPLHSNIINLQKCQLTLAVKETGSTYVENARIKASAYLDAFGLPVLADDSGVEVDALDGTPGIFSARFSPKENATDADRRMYLLEKLEGKPQPWTAHFHCSAVLALPNGKFFETTGRCNGVIIPEDRGTGGFGYDPIFFIPEYEATMAELPSDLKNQISHRARALSAMVPLIQQNFPLD